MSINHMCHDIHVKCMRRREEKKRRSNARHKSFGTTAFLELLLPFLVQMKIEDNRGQKGIS